MIIFVVCQGLHLGSENQSSWLANRNHDWEIAVPSLCEFVRSVGEKF